MTRVTNKEKKELSKDIKGLDRELLSNIIIKEIGQVLIIIKDYRERINFNIIRLGNIDIVLGMLQFVKHNLEVDQENK